MADPKPESETAASDPKPKPKRKPRPKPEPKAAEPSAPPDPAEPVCASLRAAGFSVTARMHAAIKRGLKA